LRRLVFQGLQLESSRFVPPCVNVKQRVHPPTSSPHRPFLSHRYLFLNQPSAVSSREESPVVYHAWEEMPVVVESQSRARARPASLQQGRRPWPRLAPEAAQILRACMACIITSILDVLEAAAFHPLGDEGFKFRPMNFNRHCGSPLTYSVAFRVRENRR